MGCIAEAGNAQQYRYFFNQEQEYGTRSEVFLPSSSELYNALRRPNDAAVLQPQAERPLLTHTLQVDLDNDKTSTLKTLLNFKKVVLVGGWRELRGSVVKAIKEKTNPSRIYLVEEEQVASFLKEYPMLGASAKPVETKLLPVLLLDTDDFIEANRPASRLRVFAHPSAAMNEVYGALGIQQACIVAEPAGSDPKQHFLDSLGRAKAGSVLLQHNPQSLSQGDLADLLTEHTTAKWDKCKPHEAHLYFTKNLPRANTARPTTNSTREVEPPPTLLNTSYAGKKDPENMTTGDKIEQLFRKLEKQASAAKTERAHEILGKLVSNIYSNPESESYRSVKGTNRLVGEHLTNHSAGVRLMETVGFKAEEGNWVNKVEVKYLRLFKTDLDLGYRQYLGPAEQ